MQTRLQRRRYLDAHNWAAMDNDILCSIFTRLPYVDLLRVNSTCRAWKAAIDLFKSCSATPSCPQIPWLIVPSYEKFPARGEKTGIFANVEENKIYPFNDLAIRRMNGGGCHCIGSSHDWLICLEEEAILYLLNPFTSHRIELPRLEDRNGNRSQSVDFVSKASLSSSPSLDNKDYYLVVIYGKAHSLAFCRDGDTSWTKLDGKHYNAIIFHENQLYAFYSLDYPKYNHLMVWDMNQNGFNLVKKIDIVNEELKSGLLLSGLFVEKFYLVEYQGTLLVVRRISKYAFRKIRFSREGEIKNLDTRFNIFKLDMEQKSWRGVEAPGGLALFLGGNESISADVRNCKTFRKDSIYYTDETVHLSGVFSLKDNCVHWTDWLDGTKREKRRTPPTWVVPLVK